MMTQQSIPHLCPNAVQQTVWEDNIEYKLEVVEENGDTSQTYH